MSGIGSRIFYLGVRAMSAVRRQTIGSSVDAVVYRYRTGIPGAICRRLLVAGRARTNASAGGARAGVFERVLNHLASDADTEYGMIDATIVRAHQHSAGA